MFLLNYEIQKHFSVLFCLLFSFPLGGTGWLEWSILGYFSSFPWQIRLAGPCYFSFSRRPGSPNTPAGQTLVKYFPLRAGFVKGKAVCSGQFFFLFNFSFLAFYHCFCYCEKFQTLTKVEGIFILNNYLHLPTSNFPRPLPETQVGEVFSITY